MCPFLPHVRLLTHVTSFKIKKRASSKKDEFPRYATLIKSQTDQPVFCGNGKTTPVKAYSIQRIFRFNASKSPFILSLTTGSQHHQLSLDQLDKTTLLFFIAHHFLSYNYLSMNRTVCQQRIVNFLKINPSLYSYLLSHTYISVMTSSIRSPKWRPG